jgi:hypothetical protein
MMYIMNARFWTRPNTYDTALTAYLRQSLITWL